ncbi:MAG: BON domain-containing protein [Pseudomonadota bacterium]
MDVRVVVAVVLSSCALSGCVVAAIGAAGAAGYAGATVAQERSVGAAISDAGASNRIKTDLLDDNREAFGEVDVEVANGLVLLSGRVDTLEDRLRAEQFAWRVEGVDDVANELVVGERGGLGSQLSDESVTARVRAALIGAGDVRSINFNVETYDGVVYLLGIARTPEERVAAAERASRVSGVEKVVSYITVKGEDDILAGGAADETE